MLNALVIIFAIKTPETFCHFPKFFFLVASHLNEADERFRFVQSYNLYLYVCALERLIE